jgi:hypothetical protein
MMQSSTLPSHSTKIGEQLHIRWRVWATAVILFLLFAAGLAVVQYGTPALAGNDGYYHMKMGYLIRTQSLTPSFPYLPFTILNQAAYYDHHMLYHAYLALFATTNPALDGGLALTQGAKIASIILPALTFVAFWALLHTQRIPYAAWWAIGLLAVSEAFLYRMSMPRAQSAALLLLVLALILLLNGRYRWLLPIGFLFVWAYNAFPLLLVVCGVYVVAVLMREQRLVWQALVYPAIGIGLGLLINPYFPQNIAFILGHLAPKLGESTTRVGNEWSPYETWTLVRNSAGALAAVLVGTLAVGWHKDRLDTRTLMALGLVGVFGLMLFQSRRFVEYFPPFALLFLTFAAAPVLQEWQAGWLAQRPYRRYLLPIAFTLLLAYPLFVTLRDGRSLMANSKPANEYADAMLWLHHNTPPGSAIFQTDWDDFTRLFFYHTDATYTAGLDPTFMELHDPDLFDTWRRITQGDEPEPSAAIRTHFGSDYVFSDLNHDDFLDAAANDPGLRELYRTDDAVIFQVLPE